MSACENCGLPLPAIGDELQCPITGRPMTLHNLLGLTGYSLSADVAGWRLTKGRYSSVHRTTGTMLRALIAAAPEGDGDDGARELNAPPLPEHEPRCCHTTCEKRWRCARFAGHTPPGFDVEWTTFAGGPDCPQYIPDTTHDHPTETTTR